VPESLLKESHRKRERAKYIEVVNQEIEIAQHQTLQRISEIIKNA